MYVKVDWKDYFGKDASESIKDYISENKTTIFPWLYDTIQFAIDNELKEVAILRFQETKIYATIKSKDNRHAKRQNTHTIAFQRIIK